ncbi:MAG: Fe-S-oxidoreductase [Prevotella sp.]|nr:Fe-S-oxidoreductase [Prevotella sp.]
MIKQYKTRTGAIFCDTDRLLEWLYVGDYGKENNIKANFLGFTKEINSVPHHEVDLEDKMVVTISTQRGCPMHCRFCDCPKVNLHFHYVYATKGLNATREDLAFEVEQAIKASSCKYTKRFNLHLARMGEPALNAENVFSFLIKDLREVVNRNMAADVIHPVFTTMLPKGLGKEKMSGILQAFCDIKNTIYDGEAGLQLSINSTDDEQRNYLFDGMSLPLSNIAEIAAYLPMPKGRKYTLNFPVASDTILDAAVLDNLFEKDKFIVKITPIHETKEASTNGISTPGGYDNYRVYKKFEYPLLDRGWDVIVFVPSKEEDEDRITCGNALLSMDENPNLPWRIYDESVA